MRAFRTVLLVSLAVIGGYLGFQMGKVYVDLTFIKPLLTPALRPLSIAGFTVIGVLGGVLAFKASFNQLVTLAQSLREMPFDDKLALIFGALLGVVFTVLLAPVIAILLRELAPSIVPVLILVTGLVLVYLSTQGALSMKSELRRLLPPYGVPSFPEKSGSELRNCKILDTNIIIDGRIADICRTGFLEGTIYVPGFVLDELQQIADSADPLRRARGRRGLDILNQMQKELPLVVRGHDHLANLQNGEPVDARLVRLAKALGGQIVTNDYNLNKVAELQGVTVLNVNELASALKPVVMPGEELEVRIIKEGREPNQGIAYLDDGTMVVVENGKRHIGESVPIVVNSVIQTVAGKMIFGCPREVAAAAQELMDRNLQTYSSPRSRRGRSQHSP